MSSLAGATEELNEALVQYLTSPDFTNLVVQALSEGGSIWSFEGVNAILKAGVLRASQADFETEQGFLKLFVTLAWGAEEETGENDLIVEFIYSSFKASSGSALTLDSDSILSALTFDDGTGYDTAAALTGLGPALSQEQAEYLLDSAISSEAPQTMLDDMAAALKLLSKESNGTPDDMAVNFIRLVLPEGAEGEFELDVSDIEDDYLLTAYLPDLDGVELALTGMEKVLLLGPGTASIGGSEPAMVVGDRYNQDITGGLGNDTLVGGGGMDTLTGGSGADIFGFNALGHYTVTDMIRGYDRLAFDIAGVTSKAQLQAFLTSVTTEGGDTTFNFGSSASITLVGVSASGLFDDMLFNIS